MSEKTDTTTRHIVARFTIQVSHDAWERRRIVLDVGDNATLREIMDRLRGRGWNDGDPFEVTP